jgi:DNA-binding phage protein
MEETNMRKVVTLKRRKKSVTKYLKAHEPFSASELKNAKLVTETLLDCIKTGDLESFREVLAAHLMTVNKVHIAKRAGIGRRTLYDLIDFKQEFNPELATVSAVIKALAA